MNNDSFYVYVYIDPRNHQEFYFGKGHDDRKLSHLNDSSDSEKTRIIREIRAEGLEPLIKVIAKGLTQEQALLIEKTLIWKLGRGLTNLSQGHYSENFRPHNTLHKDLFGFDYQTGIYCINIGEGTHRNWDDCRNYGFISAGQDWDKWGSRICSLRPNDILCGYLSKHGYVGVARVLESAVPANSFRYQGKLLSSLPLMQPKMLDITKGEKNSEYVLKVEWMKSVERKKAVGGDLSVWRSRSMLGSLETQPQTLLFLEQKFNVSFDDLLAKSKRAS